MTSKLRPRPVARRNVIGRFCLSKVAASAIAALTLSPGFAAAANCTWLPATGNWANAGNWSCGVVPSGPALDTATIAAGRTSTINTAQSIFALNNAGSINIDAFLLTLQSGGSTTNSGTINIGGPVTAALQLSHGINNAGGLISVANGSFVNQLAGSITGGTITTTGTGALVSFSSASNVLSGVTLNGTVDVATVANSRQRIANGLTLNGTARVANGGILSLDNSLTAGANQTLAGNGTIHLNDAGARLAVDGAGTTTLGSGITVRGRGNIGQAAFAAGNHTLVNNGLISADVSGGTLNVVNPANGGGSSLVNNGTLKAAGGGVLQLSTDVLGGAGGQVIAEAGSQVLQNGVKITGVINTSGSGLFSASSSASNVLDGVTLNGALDLVSVANARERVVNGLALNGSIQVGNSGILSLDRSLSAANYSVSGTGTIHLIGSGARLAVEGAGTTTLGANITVRGQGNIGQAAFAAGNHTLVNDGVISADVTGGTLDVTNPANGGGSSLVNNNGTLRATNGGALRLSTNVNGAGSSQIVADAGSQVIQNGVRITGTINTSGSGRFSAVSSGSNFLDGVTLNGALDLVSFANARERIANGLVLNGDIRVGNSGILSLDRSFSAADQSVGGTGTIHLNGPGARLAVEGAGTTTLGANITVRGEGNIGQAAFAAGNHTLVNNGLISADVNGGTLDVTNPANGGGSSLVNNGTLRATNGGALRLSTNVNGAGSSQIVADAGSQVIQNGVRITGTINTSGSGRFSAVSSGSNFLDGVTLNGALDLVSFANARERIANGLVLNGDIRVGNSGILSLDRSFSAADQSVGGTGTIHLNGPGARLAVEGAGTTTLGANITVRGQGNIGQAAFAAGNHTLVNNGLISADVAGGTLNLVNPANGGGSSVTNHGIVQAVDGATLAVSTDMINAIDGTMTAGVGSLINFQTASFVNQGLIQGDGVVRTLNATTTLANNGHVAPGVDGIGTLTLNGRYSQAATGTLDIGINSLTSFDLFRVNGPASLNGTLSLFCVGNCAMAVGDEITILDASSLTGTFTSLALSGFGSGQFDVLYDTLSGDVRLLVKQTVTAVPLPPTVWLMISGLAGVGLARWASKRPVGRSMGHLKPDALRPCR